MGVTPILPTVYRVTPATLSKTFAVLRRCGAGRQECQVLWISPWSDPGTISAVVHPVHRARGDGFELDGAWLTGFLTELARENAGVRLQIHTHPGEAFHSQTDDAWPIVHTPGFLSLVIPDFAQSAVGFTRAFLTELQPDGTWRKVCDIAGRLEVT